jgi:hypothetical protein
MCSIRIRLSFLTPCPHASTIRRICLFFPSLSMMRKVSELTRRISHGCVWTNFFGTIGLFCTQNFPRGEGVEPALPAGRRGEVFGHSLIVYRIPWAICSRDRSSIFP